MISIWTLPGPAAYLQRVADAIRAGKTVVLPLPEDGPRDLEAAVRSTSADAWHWISAEADDSTPPLVLFRHLLDSHGIVASAKSVRDLHSVPGISGHAIWMDGIGPSCWPAWKDFLKELEESARAVPEVDRFVLMIPLPGRAGRHPPTNEVALQCLPWRGVVGDVDAWIYAASRLSARKLPRLHRRLAASCIARVSMWDLSLADHLLARDLPTIVDPWDELAQHAFRLGWTSSTEAAWWNGARQEFEGVEETHSALFAATGRKEEVHARLWAAQAAVLLPAIEERRKRLLPQVARYLLPPFQMGSGEATNDLADLEIGQIHFLLQRQGGEASIKRKFRKLRDMRNALAHLEPLRAEQALDDVLL